MYYNENYAGLAAEIFGLTETANIQSDDSTVPSDEGQLPSSEMVAATIPSDDNEDEVPVEEASNEAETIACDVSPNTTDISVSISFSKI